MYVVRHCKGVGQEPEARLAPEGQAQAVALADFLASAAAAAGTPIERIVSSPFARAQETIAPLAARLGIPVEEDARLAERTLAVDPREDWLGHLRASFDDVELCLEGGESSRAAMKRAVAAAEDACRHPAAATVLVTHGNLMTLLLRHFDERFGFAAWRRLTNPDVFRVTLDERGARVERIWPAEP